MSAFFATQLPSLKSALCSTECAAHRGPNSSALRSTQWTAFLHPLCAADRCTFNSTNDTSQYPAEHAAQCETQHATLDSAYQSALGATKCFAHQTAKLSTFVSAKRATYRCSVGTAFVSTEFPTIERSQHSTQLHAIVTAFQCSDFAAQHAADRQAEQATKFGSKRATFGATIESALFQAQRRPESLEIRVHLRQVKTDLIRFPFFVPKLRLHK